MRRWLSRFSRLPVTFNHTHVVRPQQLSPMWITAREPVCEIGKAHQRRRRSSCDAPDQDARGRASNPRAYRGRTVVSETSRSRCASSAFPLWDVSNGRFSRAKTVRYSQMPFLATAARVIKVPGSVEGQRAGDDCSRDEYADQAQSHRLPQSAVRSRCIDQNRADRHTR